jgi:hypothetical protein
VRRSIPYDETDNNFTAISTLVPANYSLWQSGNLLINYANMIYEVR